MVSNLRLLPSMGSQQRADEPGGSGGGGGSSRGDRLIHRSREAGGAGVPRKQIHHPCITRSETTVSSRGAELRGMNQPSSHTRAGLAQTNGGLIAAVKHPRLPNDDTASRGSVNQKQPAINLGGPRGRAPRVIDNFRHALCRSRF